MELECVIWGKTSLGEHAKGLENYNAAGRIVISTRRHGGSITRGGVIMGPEDHLNTVSMSGYTCITDGIFQPSSSLFPGRRAMIDGWSNECSNFSTMMAVLAEAISETFANNQSEASFPVGDW